MTYNSFTKKLACSIIYGLIVLFNLTGCSQHDYKTEADETVYNIIDKKWDPRFGSKTDYKISDTPALPNDIQIEKVIPASGLLTLPRAVAIATAYNRQYHTEREALYIKALDLRLARRDFEPQFFGGAMGGYAKEGNDEAVAAGANFGFSQLLATGTSISTNVSAAWVEILTGNMRSGLTNLLSTTITQPLLRGSNSKIVLENLTQAERDALYQIRLFNRFRKTFVVAVISQYYLVLQQLDFLENAKDNYATLIDVYQRAEKLALAGRLPRYEMDQAHQDKLIALDTYVQAQKNYKQSLDEFKITLSLPPVVEFQLDQDLLQPPNTQSPTESGRSQIDKTLPPKSLATDFTKLMEQQSELLELIRPDEAEQPQALDANTEDLLTSFTVRLDGTELDALRGIPLVKPSFSKGEAIETAVSSRLDLANSADAIDDAKRKIVVAADNLRADLNLSIDTQLTRDNRTDFDRLRTTRDTANIGLGLDLPLERTAEANEYRKALITLAQSQRDYEQATDVVTLEVRQAYRDLTEAAERYAVQLESLTLAKERFKNTLALLQFSRADTRDVLDAQDDLFDAQNTATEALVNYTIATLNFYRDTGVLQVRPDGMWEY